MPHARDPDSHLPAPPKPSKELALRTARKRRRKHDFVVQDVDPRMVDQLGAGVYKYHPVLRMVIFLGLASALWAVILVFSFGLLSSFF